MKHEGRTSDIETELAEGADVNLTDEEGYTPLHWACQGGHTRAVELLLDSGANVEHGRDGFTALHAAAAAGHKEIVDFLLTRGANINARDSDGSGRTALTWAAQEGHVRVAETLIDHGADINAADEHGFTALLTAVGEGHFEFVKFLLGRGADVNGRNTYDNEGTALHTAAVWNRIDIARLLLDHGAQPVALDANRKTPLELAKDCGNSEVVTLLEGATRGADDYEVEVPFTEEELDEAEREEGGRPLSEILRDLENRG